MIGMRLLKDSWPKPSREPMALAMERFKVEEAARSKSEGDDKQKRAASDVRGSWLPNKLGDYRVLGDR